MTPSTAPTWVHSGPEASRRWHAWDDLGQPAPGANVLPADLRRLRLYGGAQGVWVDREKTVSSDFLDGIAVSVLHTGSDYPDEMSERGVRYHYPVTKRPPQPERRRGRRY